MGGLIYLAIVDAAPSGKWSEMDHKWRENGFVRVFRRSLSGFSLFHFWGALHRVPSLNARMISGNPANYFPEFPEVLGRGQAVVDRMVGAGMAEWSAWRRGNLANLRATSTRIIEIGRHAENGEATG